MTIIAPSSPCALKREQADGDDRHVRDRGIGDQLLHVVLHQRDQAGADHRDHRQAEDQPHELREASGNIGRLKRMKP